MARLWMATANLRMYTKITEPSKFWNPEIEPFMGIVAPHVDGPRLQQLWTEVRTGKTEWRDVEYVTEVVKESDNEQKI